MPKKEEYEIESKKVEQILVTFDNFGKKDHVCITEWANGEGFDLGVGTDGNVIEVDWFQWEAIRKGMRKLFSNDRERLKMRKKSAHEQRINAISKEF